MNKRLRDERGAMVVIFGVVLPLILLVGVLAVDVGNWFIHQKRLQTLADAGALASSASFTGCPEAPATSNANITAAALSYAGDKRRDSLTKNVQEQETSQGDVHVVLNGTRYWDSSDGTLPGANGYGLDNGLGTACSLQSLDVKATDDTVPLLFGFIPVASSPHARARVEMKKVVSLAGVLPVGIPEFRFDKVGVVFVNEDGAVNDGTSASISGASWLVNNAPVPPPDPSGLQWYQGDVTNVDLTPSGNYNTIVVTSRNPAATISGSLQAVCTQAGVTCYGKSYSMTSGLSFIHSWADNPGSVANPQIRDVNLAGGCGGTPTDYSAPYFNLNAGCAIAVMARIDFGIDYSSSGNPTTDPNVCAQVPGYSWSRDGSPQGVFTGSITPANNSGRNVVNISGSTKKIGLTCLLATRQSFSFPRVAAPFAASDGTSGSGHSSGPVEYLWIANNNAPGGPANSINAAPSASLHVTLGLTPPLELAQPSDPPIALRFTGGTPSQTQALDCLGSGGGPNGWRLFMVTGCKGFGINKRNGSCATPYPTPIDCIDSETGNFNDKGVEDKWPSCAAAPNNWNRNGYGIPPASDPRWVVLFVLDENAFTSPGKKTWPIRNFAGFYVTAGDGFGKQGTSGCVGDDPRPINRDEIWGHFGYYTNVDPNAEVTDELCDPTVPYTCAAVLVE